MDNRQRRSINRLESAVRKLSEHYFFRMNESVWTIIWFSLLRGLAFGLGTVLGATILVYVLVLLLSQIEFIPIIGEWAARIIEQIQKTE
jgi:hypothetical protein|tara:strand:- start:108 stop:374 length:267 start_codon:yes stop_codon:yes gene_type:complete